MRIKCLFDTQMLLSLDKGPLTGVPDYLVIELNFSITSLLISITTVLIYVPSVSAQNLLSITTLSTCVCTVL